MTKPTPPLAALVGEAEDRLRHTAELLDGQPSKTIDALKKRFGAHLIESLVDWNEGRITWESCCERVLGRVSRAHLN